jgi:hypothetical protein
MIPFKSGFTVTRNASVRRPLQTSVTKKIAAAWVSKVNELPMSKSDRLLAIQQIRRICNPQEFSIEDVNFENYFKRTDKITFRNLDISNIFDLLTMLCEFKAVSVEWEFWRDYICSLEVHLAEDNFVYVPVSSLYIGDGEKRIVINNKGKCEIEYMPCEFNDFTRPMFEDLYPTVCLDNFSSGKVQNLELDFSDGYWGLDSEISFGPKINAVQASINKIFGLADDDSKNISSHMFSWNSRVDFGTDSFMLNPLELVSVMMNLKSSNDNYAPRGNAKILRLVDGKFDVFDTIMIKDFSMSGILPIDYKAINDRVKYVLADIGMLDYFSYRQSEIPY